MISNLIAHYAFRVCKDPLKLAAGFHWNFKELEQQIEIPDTPTEKNPDDEARAKMSDSKIGRPLSDEHKATISAFVQTKKPVICVETGVIYESITEASRSKNLRVTNISRACHNPRNTACSCHRRFVEEPAETPAPAENADAQTSDNATEKI